MFAFTGETFPFAISLFLVVTSSSLSEEVPLTFVVKLVSVQYSSVQLLSRVQLFVTP